MHEVFKVKFCSWNAVAAEDDDCVNLVKVRKTSEPAIVKYRLLIAPPTGVENYQCVKAIRRQEQKRSFKIFPLVKQKRILTTLESMQNTDAFFQNKDMEISKHGYTLRN